MAQTTIDVNVRDNASKVLRDISGSLGGLAKLAGAAFGVREIARAIGAYQDFQNTIQAATSSTQEFASAQAALIRSSTENYRSIGETANIFSTLRFALDETAASTDEVARLTNTLQASFRIANTSTQNAASATAALAKAFQTGVIDARGFREIVSSTPNILLRLQAASGLSREAIFKLASEGRLSADGLRQALLETEDQTKKLAQASGVSLNDALAKLGNSFNLAVGSASETSGALKLINNILEFLADNMELVITAVAGLVAGLTAAAFIGAIANVVNLAKAVRSVGVAAAFASGGLTVIAGLLGVGVALGAEKLYDYLNKSDEKIQQATGNTEKLATSTNKVKLASENILSAFDKYILKLNNSEETNKRLQAIEEARLALGRQLTAEEQKRLNIALDQKAVREAEKALPTIAKQVGGTFADKNPDVEAERLKQEQLQILRDAGEISEQEYQTAIGVIQANAARARLERQKQEVEQTLKMLREGNASKADIEKLSQEQKVQVLYQGGKDALNALAQFNEKAFKIAKALAIAESLQNTYRAVSNALATFPFPLNIAIAGIMAARGYAEVQKIRGTQYTGARRQGGLVGENQSYLVGEDGPEMFTPSSSGRITSNDQMSQGVTVNFNISTVDADGFDEILINRRSTIVGIINEATNKRGRVGVTQ
jgi:tape measure domain-containing protein